MFVACDRELRILGDEPEAAPDTGHGHLVAFTAIVVSASRDP
jgi:hypothetical protein